MLGYRFLYVVLIAGLAMLPSLNAAFAIDGIYLRENGLASSHLRVFNCGGGKGIRVEESTHKASLGKVIMCGAKPDGGAWSGKILNLEDGKTYSATISKSGDKLKLRGCITGTFLCENQYMPRIK